jgi:hypothetical protein
LTRPNDAKGFSEAKLRRAYGQARNADIAAHILGFVRQAALGHPLVPYEARVENALRRIEGSRNWTPKQKQWLRRLGRALKEQPVGDRSILRGAGLPTPGRVRGNRPRFRASKAASSFSSSRVSSRGRCIAAIRPGTAFEFSRTNFSKPEM